MKAYTVVLFFFSLITSGIFQNGEISSIPHNKVSVNSLDYALRYLGISFKDPLFDWKTAFGLLAVHFTMCEKAKKKFQLLLGLRAEIEFLPRYVWPQKIDKPGTRQAQWTMLLTDARSEFITSNPILELRHRITVEKKMTVETFVTNIVYLYGEFSDDAAHKIKIPEGTTPENIDSVVELIGNVGHKGLKSTIEVLITPLQTVATPSPDDIKKILPISNSNAPSTKKT